jgi:hypothetical protein
MTPVALLAYRVKGPACGLAANLKHDALVRRPVDVAVSPASAATWKGIGWRISCIQWALVGDVCVSLSCSQEG